jgi:hypothetical protein
MFYFFKKRLIIESYRLFWPRRAIIMLLAEEGIAISKAMGADDFMVL